MTVKVDYLQEQDPRENLISFVLGTFWKKKRQPTKPERLNVKFSSKNNRKYPNFAIIWETKSFAFLELLGNNLTRILNRKYDVKLQLLLVNVPLLYQVSSYK